MKVFTKNRMVTVALAVGAVWALYNYSPTRERMFPSGGWF